MKRVKSVLAAIQSESVEQARMRFGVISLVDPGFMTRMGVHFGLFLGALTGQGTPEQIAYWMGKGAFTLNGMIGCFAMTELGHGSNVAGLETLAVFDEENDEFVIHTPTLTATKFWIGGAGQSATHSAVFARMIVKGKCYGVKSFIVPLRDPSDFSLLPGISIGDLGPKMGRNAIDNGWIRFTHVRIPRSNMLMKHTKVSREGVVTEPPLQQLAYGALILGRVTMIMDSADIAKKALTIAIRYSAIRRQFALQPGEIEKKILDYATHQYRLMPLLATTFAMNFAGLEVTKIYDSLVAKLDSIKPSDPKIGKVLDSLKETHATAAGLKAFCTWTTLNIIEQSRQALGGHGYSSYAGLASLYQDFAVQCTWEGDNTVLTLQLG
ncbi:acyl-CoA dehydrogenase NM domain-like protein, partial [Rozella allomycis CSF55]